MNILIILLGCNILRILNDRVSTAVNFAMNREKEYNDNIIWFLSGGIKYNNEDNINTSEAQQMADSILREKDTRKNISNNNNDIINNNKEWTFILDTNSTNTAENFMMVNQLLNTNNISSYINTIYVVTSKYHYKRAKLISDYINKNNTYEWILSPLEEINSNYWENIHIKNVEKDVHETMKKFKFIK